MSMELTQVEKLVSQRPNSPRVIRMLRELLRTDDDTRAGLLALVQFSIVGVTLTSAVVLIGLSSGTASAAQDVPLPSSASVQRVAVEVAVGRHDRLTPEKQTEDYTAWLREAHAHAAQFGRDEQLPSTF